MRKYSVLLAVAVVALSLTTSQAFLYDWVANPAGTAQSVMDPAGDDNLGPVSSRDIVQLWYARDAANHYFRMDLAAAPAINAGAGEYSIQIDSALGGGTSSDSGYIASGLTGIDQLVMSHFSAPTAVWTSTHRHNYQGSGNPVTTDLLGDLGGAVEFAGSTIEWSIPFTQLFAGPFNFYGATSSIDVPLTFDTTSGLTASVIPEPSALALGLAGLILTAFARKRR